MCQHPRRHIWGGPPSEIANQPGFQPTGIKPAVDLAFAPRGEVKLAQVVLRDLPEIGIQAGKNQSGCGCATTGHDDVLGGALLLGVSLLVRRRRQPRGAQEIT